MQLVGPNRGEGFCVGLWIVEGNGVLEAVGRGAPEPLCDGQGVGVRQAGEVDLSVLTDVGGLHHQAVAVPMAHGGPVEGRIGVPGLAAVEVDATDLSRIFVQHGHLAGRLDDLEGIGHHLDVRHPRGQAVGGDVVDRRAGVEGLHPLGVEGPVPPLQLGQGLVGAEGEPARHLPHARDVGLGRIGVAGVQSRGRGGSGGRQDRGEEEGERPHQNMPLELALEAGMSCTASQCSTTLPLSSLKRSKMARPAVPGVRVERTCRIT